MHLILFLFFILNNYLQQLMPGVNYFDELLTFCALYFILKYHRNNRLICLESKQSIRCVGIVLIIGIISTITHNIQPQFAGVWRDALAIIKFPVCYYAFYLYSKSINTEQIQKRLLPWAKFFVAIICMMGALTFIFKISLFYREERYGFPLFDMAFSHATFLVVVLFVLLSVIISSGFKKNILFVFMGVIGILLTLRSKPMVPLVFLGAVWIARLYKGRIKLNKKNIFFYSLLIIILSYYAAYSQISTYLGYAEEAARGACYYYGADLANKFFPLGSGFCTFSSSLSGVYYSPIYREYGLDWMKGLTPEDFSYAADTFWPNIYSQYGWFGLLIYILMLFYIIKSINKRFNLLSDKWIAGMMVLLYTLSAAFAEAIYTNDSSVIFAITLSIFLGKDENNTINK